MGKLMTLDILSSIKGATSSKAVDELFLSIKNAHTENTATGELTNVVAVDDLREDKVIESAPEVRAIIKNNFPKEKNGYLVVSKVIEN